VPGSEEHIATRLEKSSRVFLRPGRIREFALLPKPPAACKSGPVCRRSIHPGAGLDFCRQLADDILADFWGRTGFDLGNAPEAACRGRCVGLVNHRIKPKLPTKNWLSRP